VNLALIGRRWLNDTANFGGCKRFQVLDFPGPCVARLPWLAIGPGFIERLAKENTS
jgi:hypothetical protein